MKTHDYWKKRCMAVMQSQYDKTDEFTDQLKKEYKQAIHSITRDLTVFYQRFAVNNQVSYADALKLLSRDELEAFKMSLSEFRRKAKHNQDGRWTQELDNVYLRLRIRRIEALITQMNQHVNVLATNQVKGTKNLLHGVYQDTYHHTLYEIQKGSGIRTSFARYNVDAVDKIIHQRWLEANFSERIWKHRDKLIRELKTNLIQGVIRGDGLDKITKRLVDKMGASHSHVNRVVQTESSYIMNQAALESYKASGVVKQYQFLSTLDSRTSSYCQDMDLNVFKLSEAEIGITLPPLHPNCRSTIIPYFDDEISKGKRAARDVNDQGYAVVPGDITYKQWYENLKK